MNLIQAEFSILLTGIIIIFTIFLIQMGKSSNLSLCFNAKCDYGLENPSDAYQNRLLPPNPPRRSSRGRASLTLRVRPFKSFPSSPEIADLAS
jgi:hypothetical protein